jgi:hypothetical protein
VDALRRILDLAAKVNTLQLRDSESDRQAVENLVEITKHEGAPRVNVAGFPADLRGRLLVKPRISSDNLIDLARRTLDRELENRMAKCIRVEVRTGRAGQLAYTPRSLLCDLEAAFQATGRSARSRRCQRHGCPVVFTPKVRDDAKYCSSACRAKAHRQAQQKDKEASA